MFFFIAGTRQPDTLITHDTDTEDAHNSDYWFNCLYSLTLYVFNKYWGCALKGKQSVIRMV